MGRVVIQCGRRRGEGRGKIRTGEDEVYPSRPVGEGMRKGRGRMLAEVGTSSKG